MIYWDILGYHWRIWHLPWHISQIIRLRHLEAPLAPASVGLVLLHPCPVCQMRPHNAPDCSISKHASTCWLTEWRGSFLSNNTSSTMLIGIHLCCKCLHAQHEHLYIYIRCCFNMMFSVRNNMLAKYVPLFPISTILNPMCFHICARLNPAKIIIRCSVHTRLNVVRMDFLRTSWPNPGKISIFSDVSNLFPRFDPCSNSGEILINPRISCVLPLKSWWRCVKILAKSESHPQRFHGFRPFALKASRRARSANLSALGAWMFLGKQQLEWIKQHNILFNMFLIDW